MWLASTDQGSDGGFVLGPEIGSNLKTQNSGLGAQAPDSGRKPSSLKTRCVSRRLANRRAGVSIGEKFSQPQRHRGTEKKKKGFLSVTLCLCGEKGFPEAGSRKPEAQCLKGLRLSN